MALHSTLHSLVLLAPAATAWDTVEELSESAAAASLAALVQA